jgi:hypothetical protein
MPIKRPDPVPPRAYALSNTPLPFSKPSFYRWEKLGLIELLRVGGKTLVSAETIEAILSGKIVLPHNSGRVNPPKPRDRGGHAKRRLKRPKPETSAAAAE